MTRKRYVKLLMSEGFSRNLANDFAQLVVERGASYQADYTASPWYFEPGFYTWDFSELNEALGRTAEAAERCLQRMADLFDDFCARFDEKNLRT